MVSTYIFAARLTLYMNSGSFSIESLSLYINYYTYPLLRLYVIIRKTKENKQY